MGCALGQRHKSRTAAPQEMVSRAEIVLLNQIVEVVHSCIYQHDFFNAYIYHLCGIYWHVPARMEPKLQAGSLEDIAEESIVFWPWV